MENKKKNTTSFTEGTTVKRGLNPRPPGKKPDYIPPAQKKHLPLLTQRTNYAKNI